MKILISGATGLVGSALLEHLFTQGHTLNCLQRNKNPGAKSIWDIERLYAGHSERPFDAIVHLAGENVASGRWTAAKKQRIMDSRVEGTRQLIDFLWTQPENMRPTALLSASAIGVYGNGGDRLLNEGSLPGMGFLAEVCKQWERQANRASEIGIRVVPLRFGMILSPKGGALHKMLPAFRAGLGGVIAGGRQFMSWVSIRDLCRSVSFILDTPSIKGPVNIVSPKAITNKDFTAALAAVLQRPARIPAPAFLVRLLFGEMADAMLLPSSRVSPDKLLQSGYSFQDKDLHTVLAWCSGIQEKG